METRPAQVKYLMSKELKGLATRFGRVYGRPFPLECGAGTSSGVMALGIGTRVDMPGLG